MKTSPIENQRGIQHQGLIMAQFGSPAKQEKNEDQPRVASPYTFIKYLQDYYESVDSLFINQASGQK